MNLLGRYGSDAPIIVFVFVFFVVVVVDDDDVLVVLGVGGVHSTQ